jgi:SAM-dependent methyltransferase
VTAARRGALVRGLDLSPVLLEHAKKNAAIAGTPIEFREGDVEELPYQDGAFDVVLSQFGHMFAPRPGVAVREMLRVLKPGGRIAFSTWPPELMVGRMFATVSQHLPPAPPGVEPPPAWGDPNAIRARLGTAVAELEFHREEMMLPALSPAHYRAFMEQNAAPVMKTVEILSRDPAKLAAFRTEFDGVSAAYFHANRIRQSFLMTRAVKRPGS